MDFEKLPNPRSARVEHYRARSGGTSVDLYVELPLGRCAMYSSVRRSTLFLMGWEVDVPVDLDAVLSRACQHCRELGLDG